MKVLIIAKEDYLGAGKAALRLYEAFKKKGHLVSLLVKNKTSAELNILKYDELIKTAYFTRLRQFVKNRILKIIKGKININPDYYFFGINDLEIDFSVKSVLKKLPFIPDCIIITWSSQVISPKAVYRLQKATKARVYLYPLDMSTLTGGCHYAWDCQGYKNKCSDCPAIIENSKKYIAYKNLKEKKKYYERAGARVVSPSSQLLEQSKASVLFKNQGKIDKVLIPIDESIFNTSNRNFARFHFKIKNHEKVIFFGASLTNEKRKGLKFVKSAFDLLKARYDRENKSTESIIIMVAGHKPKPEIYNEAYSFPFKTFFLGYIDNDETLSKAYQASDMYVTSSIQDSGPMMINESIMCGTPVVTFEIGVSSDLVLNDFSGLLVQVGDIEGLSNGMYCVLNRNNLYNSTAIEEFGKAKTSYHSFKDETFKY